ncbi:zeatin o-glucosyltransferase [Phtheirospermum japonicum]|uniref:Glycosyltransferase n=1 Tax=Phtheirospermum japonicum TaxID=374723 RepID=A0A830C3X2_9LAMI|nr:zeatin o-glucosyltransferase [Phtheirospermum japonicum]
MATNGQKHTVVLMVPFPLQGHLNQLLHLSRLISAYGIPVHYAADASHNHQARRRIQGWDPLSISNNNIIFHELPSLSFRSPPPDPNAPIPFPSHLQPLIDATSGLRRPVIEIIRRLCAESRRVVIIYDSLMGSVIQDFVGLPNAEAYTFHSVSAYAIFFFLWESLRRPFQVANEILGNLPSPEGCFTPEFKRFVRAQHEYAKLSSGRVYNTCRVLERPFMELLEKPDISGGKKQWALGPFNPVEKTESGRELKKGSCLKWLDGLGPNSVILVSFGTTTTLSEKQIQELAMGLERSEQSFIWVLRDADRGDDVILNGNDVIKKVNILPEGFEERVRERGIVVRDWAPQLEILGHFAVGGFMSHCGWNSCMESISMGVPIAAWPMHSDQPKNAVLVTEILRIGLLVRDWGRRDEILKASNIESGVRRLMASQEGAEARKRAAELSAAVREAMATGGSAQLEFDSFISHITR